MCSNLGSGSANASIATTLESRCTAFVTSQIWRVATKWDILTHAQDTINWLHSETFHNQTTSVDYVSSAVGNAYRTNLASQHDTLFETQQWGLNALGQWALLPSNSYYFTDYLVQLNSDLNQGNAFSTLWNSLMIYQYAETPLNAHKMKQVIFGLLGQNVFGY